METTTSADGTTIAFDRVGTGAPLILVAGATCDRRVGARYADALAGRFQVLNHDRRGRGDSTDTPPYAVDREIDDIAAVAASAGDEGAGPVLVGLSSGAVLAALAAARLRTAALVMWEPPFAVTDADRRRSLDYGAGLERLLAAGDRDGAFELFLRGVGMPDPAIDGMRRSPYWADAVAVAPTLAYDAAVMGDGTVPADILAGLSVPVLILAGQASPPPLREGARAAADAIPGARLEILAGQTHDVAPESLAAAVRDFVPASLR